MMFPRIPVGELSVRDRFLDDDGVEWTIVSRSVPRGSSPPARGAFTGARRKDEDDYLELVVPLRGRAFRRGGLGPQVNIRGINGSRDSENSFAFILDGILMSNPAAFNREYLDLQQIEILKGIPVRLQAATAACAYSHSGTSRAGRTRNHFSARHRLSHRRKR